MIFVDLFIRYGRCKVDLICAVLALMLVFPAARATVTTALAAPGAKYTLEGNLGPAHHAQFYRDSQNILKFNDIQYLPDEQWMDLPRGISEGFTSATIWVRFRLTRSISDAPGEWFLELDQPLLADVRLYTQGPDGRVEERFGTTISTHQKRELNYRNPTFLLKELTEGEQTYWLRIATPTALQTALSLRKANGLMVAHARNDFVWGMMFGTYLFVVVFYTFFWFWTRERIHLFYTLYILINFLAAIFTSGWPLQYIDGMTSQLHIKYLGLWVAISLSTGTLMSSEFLQLPSKHPRATLALRALALALTLVGLIGVMLNQYARVIPFLQISSIFLIFGIMVFALRAALGGDRTSRTFLIAFSLFYIGVIWRYMRNLGWVEPNFWNDNSYQLGAFAHMLMMSLTIFAGYSRLLKEKNKAELQLRYESQMRLDQSKFVDLVSHEFRTPLSVVQATIDNLQAIHGDDPETVGRLEKIDRANQRMHTLIRNYMSTERMMIDAHNPNFEHHNLINICRFAIEDLTEADRERVVQNFPTTLDIRCDLDLIRIAVHNLLQNACKHCPDGQQITLSVTSSGQMVSIAIADSGEGIAPEDMAHIFTRHYRGNSLHQPDGSGLGLYIAQSIATGHRGRVTVRQNSPKGSIFTLELPL